MFLLIGVLPGPTRACIAGNPLDWVAQQPAKPFFLPSHSRANFIRIVSGKGDFEHPAWRSNKQRVAPKSHCLTIRCCAPFSICWHTLPGFVGSNC